MPPSPFLTVGKSDNFVNVYCPGQIIYDAKVYLKGRQRLVRTYRYIVLRLCVAYIDHVLTDSKLYFTACGNDQYDCEDLTCIASELRCNQVENCRFRWDEDGCPVRIESSIITYTRLLF